MNDYLSVIRLGQGAGQPGKQACWMTALSSHIGGEWTDKCACVDPTINRLCILANDFYGEGKESANARTEDVMDFGLFDPLGTLGDEKSQWRRAWHCWDAAVRAILPEYYRLIGKHDVAKSLESLPEIVDRETATNAADAVAYAANAVADAADGTYAAYAAANAADAAADAADAANAADAAEAVAYAADAVAYAVADAANAADAAEAVAYAADAADAVAYAANAANAVADAADGTYAAYAAANAADAAANAANVRLSRKRQFLRKFIYPLIRELIDLGPSAPKEVVPEPACGTAKFLELCGVK